MRVVSEKPWPRSVFLVVGVLALVAIAWLYRSTAVWMTDRWFAPDSYYNHGWLVPLVALFLAHRALKRTTIEHRPRPILGLSLILLGGGIHLVSLLAQVHFTSGFSVLFIFLGLLLSVSGAALFRALLFPVLFLGFMIPIPLAAIADLSLSLKLIATRLGGNTLVALGTGATLDGPFIRFGDDKLIIGDACSGLRSLIALTAFAVLFSSISPVGWMKKTFLSLSSLPVAILANAGRIVFLGVVTFFFGSEAIQGLVHDVSGLLIYVLAFWILFMIERVLAKLPGKVRVADGEKVEERAGSLILGGLVRGRFSRSGATASVLILFGMGYVGLNIEGASSVPPQSPQAMASIPYHLSGAVGRDEPLSDRTYELLETRDVLFRQYESEALSSVNVCIVFSGDNRKTAHPPEVCYRASGLEVESKDEIILHPDGDAEEFGAYRIVVSGQGHRRCAIYWYVSGDHFGRDYMKQQAHLAWNSFRGGATGGAMVRISTAMHPTDDLLLITERLQEFGRELAPYLR